MSKYKSKYKNKTNQKKHTQFVSVNFSTVYCITLASGKGKLLNDDNNVTVKKVKKQRHKRRRRRRRWDQRRWWRRQFYFCRRRRPTENNLNFCVNSRQRHTLIILDGQRRPVSAWYQQSSPRTNARGRCGRLNERIALAAAASFAKASRVRSFSYNSFLTYVYVYRASRQSKRRRRCRSFVFFSVKWAKRPTTYYITAAVAKTTRALSWRIPLADDNNATRRSLFRNRQRPD